jgi:hypothetical protein
MAWMDCRGCSTRFAVGLLRCPKCGAVSQLYAMPEEVEAEQEANVPKISVEGGPSNALGQPVEPEVTATEVAEPVLAEPPVPVEAEMSDATSDAMDEGTAPEEAAAVADVPLPASSDAAVPVEPEPAPAPKPAKKSAAKKTAAKPEPVAQG